MFFRLGNVAMDTYLGFFGQDTICPPRVTEKILELNASGEYQFAAPQDLDFPDNPPQ